MKEQLEKLKNEVLLVLNDAANLNALEAVRVKISGEKGRAYINP